MRILFAHNYYQQRGGEDIYFEKITALLQKKGHEVYSYVRKSNEIQNLGDKISTALNIVNNKKTTNDLQRIIDTFKPQIAHFNNIFPLITPHAYSVCKKGNIPVVQTIQTYRMMCPKGFVFRDDKICELCVKRIFALPAIQYNCYHNSKLASISISTSLAFHKLHNTFHLVDKYICPADFVKEYHLEHLSLPAGKFTVIPHFTDIKITDNHTKNADYFLFAGRLSEEKGILPLLQQFAQMPQVKLVVVGDGPLQTEVAKYITKKNITIYPFASQEKVFSLMKHALATIIPSPWYEIGPLVLMESFANGTPVVVPHLGVFKERIVGNQTGFFFDYTQFNSLKNVINAIAMDKQQIQKMRRQVQLAYKKQYSAEAYYEKLIQTYKELI